MEEIEVELVRAEIMIIRIPARTCVCVCVNKQRVTHAKKVD